ncbi:Receptor-type tyrosine-protein phosphatase U [Amphibalanus amphitrite]|uniref:Receptor-type tyrosine-protein phosphatase U n=1 Tax=Amphibalanus amphitrite TaxID=1232801 RepID=A0A6A4VZR6_AMPAM|nr:Receptor-type tyrosine-protein phosphatase U [Amphibalanus amphitrite]
MFPQNLASSEKHRDGAGRSGVFLAIDANIELAEEDGVFDVYGYLKKMRQSRRGLIETIDQYKFVYDTLEEFVTCGYSSFPVSELSQRLKEKAVKGPDKLNDYQREFNQICRQVPKFTIGDCAGGHRADNRHKNRDVMIVPPDNFRPYLTSFQGTSATDYINAVFVDEYNRAREYIVTEWPLRSTQSDFWSLVYDHDCNSIVVLTSPGDSSGCTHPREYIVTEWPLAHTVPDLWSMVYDHDCSAVVVLCNPETSPSFPHFWPESTRSKKYGAVFTVEHISHQHYQNIKSWIFKINKKEIAPYRKTISTNVDPQQGSQAEVKTCQLFQLTCWPAGYKVPTSTNALVELMNMVERWRQRSGYGPVVVVSPDGQCRAGVYCAANACIEQVIQHGEVDVFQAVKTVRRHRPQLISNMSSEHNCAGRWLIGLELICLVQYLVQHYVPTWFVIRQHNACTEGSKNVYRSIELLRGLPQDIQDIIRPVISRNGYWAHPEQLLLAMVADEDREIRTAAIQHIRAAREREKEGQEVRKFTLPTINFGAQRV